MPLTLFANWGGRAHHPLTSWPVMDFVVPGRGRLGQAANQHGFNIFHSIIMSFGPGSQTTPALKPSLVFSPLLPTHSYIFTNNHNPFVMICNIYIPWNMLHFDAVHRFHDHRAPKTSSAMHLKELHSAYAPGQASILLPLWPRLPSSAMSSVTLLVWVYLCVIASLLSFHGQSDSPAKMSHLF